MTVSISLHLVISKLQEYTRRRRQLCLWLLFNFHKNLFSIWFETVLVLKLVKNIFIWNRDQACRLQVGHYTEFLSEIYGPGVYQWTRLLFLGNLLILEVYKKQKWHNILFFSKFCNRVHVFIDLCELFCFSSFVHSNSCT